MKLVAELLRRQDPSKPHTLLTRVLVSLIIVFASLVYAGFFGVIISVAFYLLAVELSGAHLGWAFIPFGLAILVGLRNSVSSLLDYWRNYGHG
jgi:hypothetical protein